MGNRKQSIMAAMILAAGGAGMWASAPSAAGVPAQMVVTVQPVHRGGNVPADLAAGDLSIREGKTSVPVVRPGLKIEGPSRVYVQ